jgi:hypothetical protein
MSGLGNNLHQNTEIAQLLSRARQKIDSGVVSLRGAAEDLAAAVDQGATQREIAKAVGKSVGWVNGLLKWRKCGYPDDTPFGPQSKASREGARVQATERTQKTKKSDARSDQAEAAAAHARAETAKAEAAKARADAEKATAEALRAKVEALRARAEAARAEADARAARARSNNPNKQKVHSGPRDLLVKTLGMLGSIHAGERDNAARGAERQRAKLGMTWDELIVRARDDDSDEIDDDDEDLYDDDDDDSDYEGPIDDYEGPVT